MIASRRLSASILAVAAFALMGQGTNWMITVKRTETSHIVGNPDAKLLLTEFVSYTCPACGRFSREGEQLVKLGYVEPGKARFEIRHVQRNVVDITATMLAWCGTKDKFMRNHSAIMYKQDEWLTKASNATTAQQNRWFSGAQAQRRKAVAQDLGLEDILVQNGYSRIEIGRCLSDQAMADKFAAASAADASTFFVTSTPSFAIDGVKLAGTSSWEALAPQLKARLKP